MRYSKSISGVILSIFVLLMIIFFNYFTIYFWFTLRINYEYLQLIDFIIY